MAEQYFSVNPQLPRGGALKNAVAGHIASIRAVKDELNTMTQMLNGQDGSSDAHFATHVTHYGFLSTAIARAAWNELASAVANQDSIAASQNQLGDRFR